MKIASHLLLVAAALPAVFLSARADEPERQREPAPVPREVNWRASDSTQFNGWYNLGRNERWEIGGTQLEEPIPGIDGYPQMLNRSNPWPSPILSRFNSNESRVGSIRKIENGPSGAPFPGSETLYFGSMRYVEGAYSGTIGISSLAIADLSTVVFQVSIGEASGHDFYNGVLPTLTLTLSDDTTIEGIAVTYGDTGPIEQAYYDTMQMEVGEGGALEDVDIFINLYALQWDLSGVSLSEGQTIESFEISLSGAEHAQIYYMQLDQSNGVYHGAVVPEPATYALLLGAGALGLMVLRRRSK